MMDATFTAVLRLHEQGESIKTIARRLKISEQKVRRILITAGAYTSSTVEYIRTHVAAGESVEEIVDALGITVKAVIGNMAYTKGMYRAEYPSKNAIAIRRFRSKNTADLQ